MSGPVYFHTQARVKEGELDAFLQASSEMVRAVSAESGALECSCFVDRENRTVSFFEVFKDAQGFLDHAQNSPPATLEAQSKQAPLIESFERVEVYGDVPAEVVEAFKAQGIPMTATARHDGWVRALDT